MKTVAVISDEVLDKCLSTISGTDAIIVGGQALAFWADSFEIDLFVTDAGITKDLDIFGNKGHLMQMSSALNLSPQIQNPRFISALVGVIEIPIGDDIASNIDVIHTIVGIDREEVRRHAINVRFGQYNCKVMHPMHVLESRIKNFEKIAEKRNEQGINQVAMAVRVANKYIAKRVLEGDEAVALKAIEKVVSLGKVASGKMIADYGVNLIDAIPFDDIQNENFHTIRKPQIVAELNHLKERTKLKKCLL